jgi:two-component system, OmpR family, phosphate regulon sensor histidine kinase PhoR
MPWLTRNLDATKTTFIRTVTHELRSPVSVTRSLLRTITDGYTGQLNEQQRDILERANRRIDFLQKLIDDLLDLAAGKVEVQSKQLLEPIILDEILQKVITRFEVPARVKGLSLEWHKDTKDQPTIVRATIDGLDRIYDNLVGNAVKYTLPNGKVILNLSHVNAEAWVTVEDTGIGISEESLSHLFEEFYRAPNARALEREGTGLGLTIVKNLVTRFGGRIAVQSTQGIGTRFTVILPRYFTF